MKPELTGLYRRERWATNISASRRQAARWSAHEAKKHSVLAGRSMSAWSRPRHSPARSGLRSCVLGPRRAWEVEAALPRRAWPLIRASVDERHVPRLAHSDAPA